MADYLSFTTSNGAKVKKPDKVQKILDSYYTWPEITLDSDRTFSWDGDEWPQAWKLPEGVTRNEFDPYDDDELGVEGEDGFVELLKEIAPYLEELLIVQSIGYYPLRYPLSAAEWHVKPGATRVKINELRPIS